MQIILSNVIEIREPNFKILQYCKSKLTYKNPDYAKKVQMGFWLGKTPKEIKLYDYYKDTIIIPIGCFDDIWESHPIIKDYIDYTCEKKINIKSNIKLRDYQLPVIDVVKKYNNGLIIMPCGFGKSYAMLELANALQNKMLWITHTKELLNQTKGYCESNMFCKTSQISDGVLDTTGDIVFATVQTLVRFIDNEQIQQDTFGILVVDEVQHCVVSADSVMMFQQCVNYFSARYKVGCTATLHTANGLHVVIPKLLGNVLYEIKKEKDSFVGYVNNEKVITVQKDLFQVPVEVDVIYTDYQVVGKPKLFDKDGMTLKFSTMISDLSMDEKRNKLILDILIKLDKPTIIVSDRVDQLKYLADKIPFSVQIDGKTPKKKREQYIADMKNGSAKFLFASYSLISEGVSINCLENIILGTPVKDFRIVVQSIGRIQRPYDGKKIAHVYDIVDKNVSTLVRFYGKRKTIYKKENYKING